MLLFGSTVVGLHLWGLVCYGCDRLRFGKGPGCDESDVALLTAGNLDSLPCFNKYPSSRQRGNFYPEISEYWIQLIQATK